MPDSTNPEHPIDPAQALAPGRIPLIAVLDDVRSLHNVGALFRTADAFGLEALWLVGITGRPPHRDIRKTALGAAQSVPWRGFENREAALACASREARQVWALEQHKRSQHLERFAAGLQAVPMPKACLWLGHEVRGVDALVLNAADAVLEIPQFGMKQSLNVSVAAGVALYRLGQAMREAMPEAKGQD